MPHTLRSLILVLALPGLLAIAPAALAEGEAPEALRKPLEEIRALLRGSTGRAEEARLIEICERASDEVLDGLVRRIDLEELLDDLDDRWFGPDHRERFLALVSRERLGALSIDARARLVRAMQAGPTDATESLACRSVLVGTDGAALRALKRAVDGGGDRHDLQKLLFHDLDDADDRRAILGHFERQGRRYGPGEVKVLSDIDDTLYASLKDRRYPSGTVYPGIRQLYRELDAGPSGGGAPGDLIYVTARPGDRFGVVEAVTHGMLRGHGIEATVLTGGFAHLRSHEAMADGKLGNVVELRQLYPECDLVFLGDSGQGDVAFGLAMRARFGARVRGVWIHDVVGTGEAERARLAGEGAVLFDTYLGAAVAAHEAGLVGPEGLRRIAEAATAELARVAFPSEAARAARQAELHRDRALAEQALRRASW